jgi:hypothetical protein
VAGERRAASGGADGRVLGSREDGGRVVESGLWSEREIAEESRSFLVG